MTSRDNNGNIEFRFFRPDVSGVTLAGDFEAIGEEWSQKQPMHRDESGWWTLELKLQPGEYRFRYVADGQWYTDFASNGVEFTKDGWNSVLVVPDEIAREVKPRRSEKPLAKVA